MSLYSLKFQLDRNLNILFLVHAMKQPKAKLRLDPLFFLRPTKKKLIFPRLPPSKIEVAFLKR